MVPDHAASCAAAEAEMAAFVRTVADADPGAPTPGCPGWTVADVAGHVGAIHRWVAHLVGTRSPVRVPRATLGIVVPDDPGALPAWLEEGAGQALAALRSADGDAPMWSWGADRHVRFWSRRMVHETAVHRVDVEDAAGTAPAVDGAVAADGIDELLDNLPFAASFSPGAAGLGGAGTLAFAATDADARWVVRLRPDGYDWSRGDGRGDATLTGTVAGLLLTLYGRRPPGRAVAVEGDRRLALGWLAHSGL